MLARAKRLVETVEDCLREGYLPKGRMPRGENKGAINVALQRLGLKPGSGTVLGTAEQIFRPVDWSIYKEPELIMAASTVVPKIAPVTRLEEILQSLDQEIEDKLRRAGASGIEADNQHILDAAERLRESGLHIANHDGRLVLDRAPQPAFLGATERFRLVSTKDNKFKFGATGDSHIGSQYHRADVLTDLYRRYSDAGIEHVFHTGNWIEGIARFNKHELRAHSLQAQVDMLVNEYPQIPGIATHAVAGDDHEGWFAQREGINIGRFAQNAFRNAGRTDWNDLGYMEAHVELVNANTGKVAILAVVHPGGGSAYALSYAIQKIIESLDGGEKPAVGLYGHYHKLHGAMNIRNVWCMQTGCTQDQTGFMRKKKLEAHVGGLLVELEQDPETGAIVSCTSQAVRYFVRGYYQNRWGHGSDVALPERSIIA
jgi:hypothetical protein